MTVQKKQSLIHFCASCCATLLCWALWIVLGTTFVALAYVAVARELPVPGFVLRRIETRLAEAGLALRFGEAQFDPTGRLLLQNVQLRTGRFSDPVLTCRLLHIRHNFWSLFAGRMVPDEIRLEGAALQLPAMLSPSGTAEAVVSDLAATVRYRHHAWQIEQFAGRVGPLHLVVQGELVPPPARASGATPLSLEDLTGRFLKSARDFMPLLQRLDAFAEPTLAVRLAPGRTDLLLTAAGAHHPWGRPLVTGPLAVTTSVRLDGAGPRPARVHFSAARLDYDEQLRADNVRGVLQAEITPDAFTGRAADIQLVAAGLTVAGERVVAPVISADLRRWPAVQAAASLQLDGEFLAAEVEAQLREQSARLHAAGRVPPALITRVLAPRTPRAEPYFRFGDPIAFDAHAVFAPGWKFTTLHARVDAKRLDSRGVQVTSARGQIDIEGKSFLAHDARVTIGGSRARGSYWMDFGTTDYRMLLDGRLRPADISGWFRGDWWLGFWNRFFAFPGPAPEGNADIQGRWREPWLSNNFVRARGSSVTVLGGDLEQVSATVFVRPGFVHAWNLEARRAAGMEAASGWFKRFGPAPDRVNGRFEFDFTGNLAPAVVGRMLEGRADEVLASLRFSQNPDVHAWGAIGDDTAYRFAGNAAGPLHYYGFPLETARVEGSVKGNDVELQNVKFAAVGGRGEARASLTGDGDERRLGFDIFVNHANLGHSVHAYEEYDAARQGKPYVATPDSQFVRKAAGSQLDIAFSAQGIPGEIASFKGSGNAALTGAELGEVHLFGLLSQVLSGLSLSFSSLKLDAARTSFTVENGAASFPDLKVTGPSAVIDARGKYTFSSNALDFKARFRPYDQPGSLLAAAMSLVINPLTSILELRLGGALGNPKWSVDVATPSSSPKPATSPAPTAP